MIALQLFRDGDSNPYFTDKGGYILGAVAISAGAGNSGSHYDGWLTRGQPFYFLDGDQFNRMPSVTFSNGTMTWTAHPDGSSFTGELVYGIR